MYSNVLRWAAATAICFVGTPLVAQPRLWIVAADPCPLVDFPEVQPAVNAASDGDLILVRAKPSHTYADFEIDGKSITLFVDGVGDTSFSQVTVRNLGLGQSVLLHGYTRAGSSERANAFSLTLADNQGPVWVQHFSFYDLSVVHGVHATNTLSAVLTDCRFSGGWGPNLMQRGNGARIEDSNVYAYDCTANGASNAQGAYVRDSLLFLSGSSITGGRGADGSSGIGSCTNGSRGATGLYVDTGAQVYELDSTLAGGPGGQGGSGGPFGPNCSSGSTGFPFVGPGTVTSIPGNAHTMASVSPIREGETWTSVLVGDAGEKVALLLSAGQQHFFHRAFSGVVAPALPGLAPLLGIMPATGQFGLQLTAPSGVVPAGTAGVVYTQSLFEDATGRVFAGAPFAWVVLDEDADPWDGCDPNTVLWVDDDAPGDPLPGSPLFSDPFEDGSLQHPFDAVQEAVDASRWLGTVRLRDGTYTGRGNDQIWVAQAITIESENGPANCTLVGARNDCFWIRQQSVNLRGLTITNAYDAIDVQNGSAVIEDCALIANVTGLHVTGPGADATVRRSIASQCWNSGMQITLDATATIENCTITDNTTGASSGAGIFAWSDQPVVMRNSVIARNSTSSGGGIDGGANTTIIGCTLVANQASTGGAIRVRGPSLIRDSIVYGNGPGPGQIHVLYGTLTVDYSDVQGGLSGVTVGTTGTVVYGATNIDASPAFVSLANGDYHLAAGSPCIDAADPAYVALPGETDIDGEARVKGIAKDIGADER